MKFGRLNFKFYFLSLLLISLGLLPTCIDQVDLDIPKDAEDAIAIQGKLTFGNPSKLELDIARLFTFGLNSLSPVNASKVFLHNNNGQSVELERIGNGIYELLIPLNDPNMEMAYLNEYYLEILLADGRVIESVPEPLLPVPEIDSISIGKTLKFVADPANDGQSVLDTFATFAVNTPLIIPGQNEKSRLRWDIERTFKITELRVPGVNRETCYINNKVSVLFPRSFEGEDIQADYLANQLLHEEKFGTQFFVEGYYASVFQESLSETAHRYFSQIELAVQRDGNMFEPPAGPIFTNFFNVEDARDPIYGYFYVTEIDTFHRYVGPSFSNFPDTFCLRTFDFTPDICTMCLEEENSINVPPPFWKE